MLELSPYFGGQSESLAAQLLITTAVVVSLGILVYWIMRRLSALQVGGTGSGRAPRLAIVDAVAIDNHRRLVLVRRDTIEHLILIGGPTDVVIENAIVRTRQRVTPHPPAASTMAQQDTDDRRPFAELPPHATGATRRAVRHSENDGSGDPIPFPAEKAIPLGIPDDVAASYPSQYVEPSPNHGAVGRAPEPVARSFNDALPLEIAALVSPAWTFGDNHRSQASPPPPVHSVSSVHAPTARTVRPEPRTASNDVMVGSNASGQPNLTPTEIEHAAVDEASAGRGQIESGALEAKMARLLGDITSPHTSW